MNATAVIAWTLDGSIYCDGCEPAGAWAEDSGVSAVFADSFSETIGSTCDGCRACFGPDGWSEPGCDPKQWRWARCIACNGVRPYRRDDSRTRHEARIGDLHCPGCGEEAHF